MESQVLGGTRFELFLSGDLSKDKDQAFLQIVARIFRNIASADMTFWLSLEDIILSAGIVKQTPHDPTCIRHLKSSQNHRNKNKKMLVRVWHKGEMEHLSIDIGFSYIR